MKKILLSLAAVAAFSAYADEVVIDFANYDEFAIKGEFTDEVLKEDGSLQAAAHYQPIESISYEGYTITCDKGTGSTDAALYLTPSTNAATPVTFRVYKNNVITVAAPEGVGIAKIAFTLNKSVNGAFASTTEYTVTGEKTDYELEYVTVAGSAKFSPAANSQIVSMTITTGEIGDNPEPTPEPTEGVTIYQGLVGNADDWEIIEGELPEGITYVWKWDNYGYMKASAYVSGKKYTVTADLVSPVIDLTDYTNITATFDHAARYQTTLKDLCKFGIRVVDSQDNLVNLPIENWPAEGGWVFVSAGEFDINAYAGKKVQFIFTYGADENDGADTWEIKNFTVKGDKDSGVEGVIVDAEAAPVYYNMQGVRVAEPANGLYIVKRGNKVTKEIVR